MECLALWMINTIQMNLYILFRHSKKNRYKFQRKEKKRKKQNGSKKFVQILPTKNPNFTHMWTSGMFWFNSCVLFLFFWFLSFFFFSSFFVPLSIVKCDKAFSDRFLFHFFIHFHLVLNASVRFKLNFFYCIVIL